MKLVLAFVVLVNVICLVSGQNDGRYRAPTTTTRRPTFRTYRPLDPKRYQNRNDGRYSGGGDGRYRPKNDGRYYGGNDGRYVHVDVKYQHIEGPSGSGAGNQGGFGRDGPAYRGTGSSGGGGGAARGAGLSGDGASRGAGSGGDGNGASDGNVTPSAPSPAPVPAFVSTAAPPVVARRPELRAPSGPSGDGWKIIHLDNNLRRDGYNYVLETANGINAEESGKIETTADGGEGLRSQGFYQYIGDDGQLYRVDYVADDNGFVPQGDHIPKTPPAIEKLLAYLASQPKQ